MVECCNADSLRQAEWWNGHVGANQRLSGIVERYSLNLYRMMWDIHPLERVLRKKSKWRFGTGRKSMDGKSRFSASASWTRQSVKNTDDRPGQCKVLDDAAQRYLTVIGNQAYMTSAVADTCMVIDSLMRIHVTTADVTDVGLLGL